jgi:hypothetical protein
VTPVTLNAPTNVEPLSLLTSVVPPPPPPVLNHNHTETTAGKISKFSHLNPLTGEFWWN